MFAAYAELAELYKTTKPRAEKLQVKQRIIDELVDEMRLRRRPNNASLIELRVYKAGASALADAHRGCGDLRRMVLAARQLQRRDFGKDLQDDLTPVVPTLIARCQATPR